jgi:type II secretory pathway component PulM
MVRYTILRLLIFFGALALLWLLGLRDRDEQLILLVVGALLSLVISYFALRPFREQYSRELAERLERRHAAKSRARTDEQVEDAEAEDAEADNAAGEDAADQGRAEYR